MKVLNASGRASRAIRRQSLKNPPTPPKYRVYNKHRKGGEEEEEDKIRHATPHATPQANEVKELRRLIQKYHCMFTELNRAKDILNSVSQTNGSICLEKTIRDILAANVGGTVEHTLPGGERVDVITDDTIYEVKHPDKYKAAIGQLIVYGRHLPNHKRVLYLTATCRNAKLSDILHDCHKNDIFLRVH